MPEQGVDGKAARPKVRETRGYLAKEVVTWGEVELVVKEMDRCVRKISPFPEGFDKAVNMYPLCFRRPDTQEIATITSLAKCDGVERGLTRILIGTSRSDGHDDGYTEFRFVFTDGLEVRCLAFERAPAFTSELSSRDFPLLLEGQEKNVPAVQLVVCKSGGGSEFDWSGSNINFKRALEDLDKRGLIEQAVTLVGRLTDEWKKKLQAS